MSSSNGRTLLRVKRPRCVEPVATLQFTGKKRARTVNDIADLLASSSLNNDTKENGGDLVWKRVETTEKQRSKRSFNIVEASLDEVVIDDKSGNKRPRLALTLQPKSPVAASPKKKGQAILDPITRLVDEKMISVLEGSTPLQRFLDFCENDDRVSHDPAKYLLHTTKNGSTNVFHLAALWNGVAEARHLLLSYPALSPILLDAPDAAGQRPYQVAAMAGNDQVAQVLEAFGADTQDYVYDVFELAAAEEKRDVRPLQVELRGGVGYLNEDGELILEALCPEDYGMDSGESDAERNDDDVDSNAEDHECNDYPDEEESDIDDEEFRHLYVQPGNMPIVMNGFHSDEGDAEYDAQYGLYNGTEGENDDRLYAYDSEYEAE